MRFLTYRKLHLKLSWVGSWVGKLRAFLRNVNNLENIPRNRFLGEKFTVVEKRRLSTQRYHILRKLFSSQFTSTSAASGFEFPHFYVNTLSSLVWKLKTYPSSNAKVTAQSSDGICELFSGFSRYFSSNIFLFDITQNNKHETFLDFFHFFLLRRI